MWIDEDKDEIDDILADDGVEDVVEDKGSKKDASEKEEAPKDIRGAIKHAIKEHSEDEDKPDKNVRRVDASDKNKDKSDDKSDEVEDKEPSEVSAKPEEKVETPPYYKNKGKAVWDKLSVDERKLIIAREKEVSDGFKQNSEKVRAFEELEQVLAPRRQAIQQFGTTPAQTIDRLFQWMEALSHQDPNHRVNAFKALSQSFGVPLERLATQQSQIQDNDADPADQQQDNNQPPAWFSQYAQSTDAKLQETQNALVAQRQEAANKFLTDWAKDKPHFEAVKPRMHALIASGVVPPKNGEIDLDEAYRQATMSDPSIAALIQQEATEKAKEDAKAKAAKDAKDKAAKLLKAKNAGSSVQPRAPSLTADTPKGKKPNGAGGKAVSVRDSIRQSLDQLRDDA